MEEKKTNKQNRTPRQSKTEKRTKKALSGANRVPEVVGKGFPEGRGSSIPQGKVIDFPVGGASSSQERWLLWSPGIFRP